MKILNDLVGVTVSSQNSVPSFNTCGLWAR